MARNRGKTRAKKPVKNDEETTIDRGNGVTETRDKNGTITLENRQGDKIVRTGDTEVRHSHEGWTEEYVDGRLVSRTEDDLTRTSVGADGTLTVVNPVTGTTEVTSPDDTIRITASDGSSVVHRPDGTQVRIAINGDTVTSGPNDTDPIIVNNSSGDRVTFYSDDTRVWSSPDGLIVKEEKDGTRRITQPDGTVETITPDQLTTTRMPDGSVVRVQRDDTGTLKYEETTHPDGRVHMKFPGGLELEVRTSIPVTVSDQDTYFGISLSATDAAPLADPFADADTLPTDGSRDDGDSLGTVASAVRAPESALGDDGDALLGVSAVEASATSVVAETDPRVAGDPPEMPPVDDYGAAVATDVEVIGADTDSAPELAAIDTTPIVDEGGAFDAGAAPITTDASSEELPA